MKMRYVILLTAFAAALAAGSPFAAGAQSSGDNTSRPPAGGMLRTMPRGTYQCALPGDAAGSAFNVVEEEQFRIGNASSYRTDAGRGTYLLRGDELTFTRGPKKDQKFRRIGTNQLRKLDGGKMTKLVCTRLGGTG
ncbi:MAG: elongation factor P [Pseudomonadota bacterium]